MNTTTLIALINEISNAASSLIAKLLSTPGISVEELKTRRDELSADTHATVDAELAKLSQD